MLREKVSEPRLFGTRGAALGSRSVILGGTVPERQNLRLRALTKFLGWRS